MKANLLILVGAMAVAANAYAVGTTAAQVAGVEVQFNQYDAANSVNCSNSEQNALIDHPITVNLIVSQNASLNLGFADLLEDGAVIKSDDFAPQIVLTNEGMNHQFILIGGGTLDATGTIYTTKVMAGTEAFYLKQVVTEGITPVSGNAGSSELVLSPTANVAGGAICAVKGQVVASAILP